MINSESWWMCVFKIIGTISFLIVLVDFLIAHKKIPLFIIAFSLMAFVGGITYGFLLYHNLLDAFFVGLLAFIAPFLIWLFCGGPVFSKSRHNKERSDNADDK